MIKEFLSRWPVIRQIRNHSDGTGPDAMTERTRQLRPRTADAEVARSVCPYCGVGCGQRVYHKNGKLISIEGDPDSPVSRGRLCPKAADTFELHTPSRAPEESEISPALFATLGRTRSGDCDGHGVGQFTEGQRQFLDYHRNGVLLQIAR